MQEKALAQRLPDDTVIDFSGFMKEPSRIHIRMTLTSPDHAIALKQAIDKCIMPLLKEYGTPAGDEIERLRSIIEDAALYVAVCPVPPELGEPTRIGMLERRARIANAASDAYQQKAGEPK